MSRKPRTTIPAPKRFRCHKWFDERRDLLMKGEITFQEIRIGIKTILEFEPTWPLVRRLAAEVNPDLGELLRSSRNSGGKQVGGGDRDFKLERLVIELYDRLGEPLPAWFGPVNGRLVSDK